jgi:hypothetical protein
VRYRNQILSRIRVLELGGGDQQASHIGVDNYAPTLAGRSFWLQEDRNHSAVAQSALWAQGVPFPVAERDIIVAAAMEDLEALKAVYRLQVGEDL